MSETPIYDNTPNNPVEPVKQKTLIKKILNPTFRKWAYGVTAATVAAGAIIAGKPEFITVVAPLIMAIFYVDKSGEPK